MIIDNTDGALHSARAFSRNHGAELEATLERLLVILKTYYFTDEETETVVETTPLINEFLVIVRRVTARGPRLVDTLTLRHNKPTKPIVDEETSMGVARPTDPYPLGWLLLSSGDIIKESPHRRINV